MSDDLSFPEVVPILRRLEGVPFVLIGGQAVNFWADRYLGRAPELAEQGPFTSKDVDFCGTRKSVETGARKLGGTALLPEPFDPTPSAGVVVFLDSQGKERSFDVLYAPLGLKWQEVWESEPRSFACASL